MATARKAAATVVNSAVKTVRKIPERSAGKGVRLTQVGLPVCTMRMAEAIRAAVSVMLLGTISVVVAFAATLL